MDISDPLSTKDRGSTDHEADFLVLPCLSPLCFSALLGCLFPEMVRHHSLDYGQFPVVLGDLLSQGVSPIFQGVVAAVLLSQGVRLLSRVY